ncbi:uncharacterized protein LOC120373711 [Mauremys reevesii]|uniref:uncharacterized protein LOC120373711 n=1 Tax=Mauremys reevesii TaxID=260615 RepID=UPI00193ED274|nr:uncharacterized protein LOC120373711 [Mauremys reevesii]
MCGNKMRTLTSGLDTAPFTWGTTREHWRYILESDVEVPVFIYSQRRCICKPAGMSKIDVLISRENLENKRRTPAGSPLYQPTAEYVNNAGIGSSRSPTASRKRTSKTLRDWEAKRPKQKNIPVFSDGKVTVFHSSQKESGACCMPGTGEESAHFTLRLFESYLARCPPAKPRLRLLPLLHPNQDKIFQHGRLMHMSQRRTTALC